MKLCLTDAKVPSGSIATGKAAYLTATVVAGFNIVAAQSLECRDELFDQTGHPYARFSYHGLKTEIPDARVLFRADKKQKARQFKCAVSGFEIESKDGDMKIRAKLSFVGEKRIEVYALLFGGDEAAFFTEITMEGAQAEMFEGEEAEVAHA